RSLLTPSNVTTRASAMLPSRVAVECSLRLFNPLYLVARIHRAPDAEIRLHLDHRLAAGLGARRERDLEHPLAREHDGAAASLEVIGEGLRRRRRRQFNSHFAADLHLSHARHAKRQLMEISAHARRATEPR